ncbi:MAG: sensor histidine kinase, partial [Vulcanimicrobiota bacterium]
NIQKLIARVLEQIAENWAGQNKKSILKLADFLKCKSYSELADVLKKLFSNAFPTARVKLFISSENMEETFNIQGENIEIDSNLIKEKTSQAGLIELSGSRQALVFSIQGSIGCVVFEFPAGLIFEPGDRSFFLELQEKLTSVMEKIEVARQFNGQAHELETTIQEFEKNLKNQNFQVAENIHDDIAQDIYAAKIQINLIEHKLKEDNPDTCEELENLKQSISMSLKNTRKLISDLRKAKTVNRENNKRNYEELIELISRIKTGHKTEIKFSGLDLIKTMAPGHSTNFTSLVKEILNNARKHSGATEIRIKMNRYSNGFILFIIDNGSGFALNESIEKQGHFGLKNIEQKCMNSGYLLQLRTSPGRGTAYRITQ